MFCYFLRVTIYILLTGSIFYLVNLKMASQIPSSPELLNDDKVKAILISDSSFDILASRLKQSVKACYEFASFVKRKYNYEEAYSKDIRKVTTHCKSTIKSNTVVVKGSFIESLEKVINYDDKLVADVRNPYIKALETMYGELISLAQNFTTLRKQLKEDGSKKEKEVLDAVNQAEKARNKYYNLCSDLEKLRNSDPSQKRITLQGRRTGSQQEEELNRKIQVADQDYNKKSNTSQRMKNELIDIHRPKISESFKNLILELDYALQVQLEKYAVYNESLIVGMGNQVTPIGGAHPSMRKTATMVDIERCLYNYLRGSRIEAKQIFTPIDYVRHPIFGGSLPGSAIAPKPRKAAAPPLPSTTANMAPLVTSVPGKRIPSNSSMTNPIASIGSTSFSANKADTVTPMVDAKNPPSAPPIPTLNNLSSSSLSTHPPAYSTLDPTKTPVLNGPRSMDSASSTPIIPQIHDAYVTPSLDDSSVVSSISGVTKLFGLPLDQVPLNEETVPLFVKKCVDLIERYGSETEGIYRTSPNLANLEELKEKIDSDPENLSILDPPDSEHVTDDYVCVVASLLKKFFACLPDPLLTNEQRENFMNAGQLEDIDAMHVQLHRIVFELPDSNYFTLRDLLVHFIHLTEMPKIRMTAKNIAIVWSNNLLGGEVNSREELQYQQTVIHELINYAPNIFTLEEEEGEI